MTRQSLLGPFDQKIPEIIDLLPGLAIKCPFDAIENEGPGVLGFRAVGEEAVDSDATAPLTLETDAKRPYDPVRLISERIDVDDPDRGWIDQGALTAPFKLLDRVPEFGMVIAGATLPWLYLFFVLILFVASHSLTCWLIAGAGCLAGRHGRLRVHTAGHCAENAGQSWRDHPEHSDDGAYFHRPFDADGEEVMKAECKYPGRYNKSEHFYFSTSENLAKGVAA